MKTHFLRHFYKNLFALNLCKTKIKEFPTSYEETAIFIAFAILISLEVWNRDNFVPQFILSNLNIKYFCYDPNCFRAFFHFDTEILILSYCNTDVMWIRLFWNLLARRCYEARFWNKTMSETCPIHLRILFVYKQVSILLILLKYQMVIINWRNAAVLKLSDYYMTSC